MGCSSSNTAHAEDPAAISASRKIDQQLAEERSALKRQVKLLILGTGESGKSTIMKQMVILHNGGFTYEERVSYVEVIYSNTIQSMQAVLEALPLLDLHLQEGSMEAAGYVEELDPDERNTDGRVREAIEILWEDPALKEAVEHRRHFQLNNSAEYFFDAVARTTDPEFLPNDDDVIRARVRTTGIMETKFQIGKYEYRVFDVGGQRSERKKWLHVFEAVDVLLFIVAISEYDESLFEDETICRMEEAMTVFGSVANSRWFASTTCILFLNKIDLFREKLGKSPIRATFPAYTGSETDFTAASSFFLSEFQSLYHQSPTLYHHFTTATDTRTIATVIDVVADTVTRSLFVSSGLI